MFKTLLFSSLLVMGVQSHAGNFEISAETVVRTFKVDVEPNALIKWNINDSCDYKMAGGFINGTMHMFVREATTQGFWLQQDVDMGFLGKAKMETHIDKENGQILEVLVNGQKQDIPEPDMDIIESRKEMVTVPKGTFEAVWLKMKDNKSGDISQMWANPTVIPISGMIKAIQPSQFGEITMELTNFQKN